MWRKRQRRAAYNRQGAYQVSAGKGVADRSVDREKAFHRD
jgi:hypothetical protein